MRFTFEFKEKEYELLKFLLGKERVKLRTILENVSGSESLVKKCLRQLDIKLVSAKFPSIKVSHGVYEISSDNKKTILKLMGDNFSPSKDDRCYYILFKLLTNQSINLSQESINLDLNRKTLQNDLIECRKIAIKFNQSIESKSGSGIVIKGDFRDKYNFLQKILVLIFLKKDYPFYRNIYRTFFQEDEKNNIEELCKKIICLFPLKFSISCYYELLSILLIGEKISKNSRGINFDDSEKELSPYQKEFLKKYKDELLSLNSELVNKNIVKISILLAKIDDESFGEFSFVEENIKKFFIRIEGIHGRLSNRNRMFMYNLLITAIHEKEFSCSSGTMDYEKMDYEYENEFRKSIYRMAREYDIFIHKHSCYKIVIFLEMIIESEKRYHDSYYKKILVVDSSVNFWLGELVIKTLSKGYYYERLQVVSYFDDFKSMIKEEEFDLVIRIDGYDDPFKELKIPVHKIDWIEFSKNREYFKKLNIKER